MKPSLSVWFFRFPPLFAAAALGLVFCSRVQTPLTLLIFVVLVLGAALLRRRLKEESEWLIDKRGVRGFGFRPGQVVSWQSLRVHVLPTRIRMESPEQVVLIPFFMVEDVELEQKIRTLKQLGAVISEDPVRPPSRHRWGFVTWVLLSLWLVLALRPVIRRILEFLIGESEWIVRRGEREGAILLLAGVAVWFFAMADDTISRVGFLVYSVIIVVCACMLPDDLRARAFEGFRNAGRFGFPLLFLGVCAGGMWARHVLSDRNRRGGLG